MHFCLVLPPYSQGRIVPTGQLYLAEALQNAGYAVSLLDRDMDVMADELSRTIRPDTVAVGISTLSGSMLGNALEIARMVRQQWPDLPLVWGGAHPTALPEQTLRHPLVDFVAVGEAENALVGLLDAIRSGGGFDKIPGIGYKRDGDPWVNPNGGYTDLNRVFDLPYGLLDMERYKRKFRIGGERWFSVLASRGCPYRCKFCSNSSDIWPNTKIRQNTFDHVANDIGTLVRKYGADGITFNDEVLFVGEKRLNTFLDFLSDMDFGVRYRAAARADTLSRLSDATWKKLRDVGFVGIGMGVESGSPRALNIMGKGITPDDVRAAVHKMNDVGIFKTFNIMTCVPGEGVDDIKETLRLIVWLARNSKESPLPFGGDLNKYIPLPGTELYQTAVDDYGFVPPASLEGWVDLDFADFREKSLRIRPWLSGDLFDYVERANIVMERLNTSFTGPLGDDAVKDAAIRDVEAFLETGNIVMAPDAA